VTPVTCPTSDRPTGRGGAVDAGVPPTFVVRVAGLPMAVLDRLSCPSVLDALDELTAHREELRRVGEQLSAALHDVIGVTTDRTVRRRLLTLRRRVYQVRPADGIGEEVRCALPADLDARLARWRSDCARLAALTEHAEAVLAAQTLDNRAVLAEVARDEDFRRGLVLASPDLHAELVRWLAAGPAPRPHRQLETSLAKYVARAAAKTTPYSTFTSLGEGRWDPAGPARAHCAAGWQRRSSVELAVGVLTRLRGELARWPQVRPRTRLRVNPSLSEDGSTARFVPPGPAEPISEIAVSPTLRRVLDTLRAVEGARYPSAQAALAALDPTADPRRLAAYLDALVAAGVLEAQLDVPDQSADHLADLLTVLAGCPGPRVQAVRATLCRLHDDLARVADAGTAAERARAVGELGATLGALSAQLDRPGWDGLPTRVHEDTVVTDLDLRLGLRSWAPVLDELRALAGLDGLYDRFLRPRLALREHFLARFGPGATVELLRWSRAVTDDAARDDRGLGALLARPWDAPAGGVGACAELERVEQLRRGVAALVRGAPVDAAGVRRLDRADLLGIAATVPELARPRGSVAFHGQPMVVAGTALFVLNNSDAGFRRAHARLRRLAGRVRAAPLDRPQLPEVGVVHADIAALGGSNLSLRASHTPYEITYPGCVSARPSHEQIPLADLDVVHEARTGRLLLRRRTHGQEVVPLNLGTLVDRALPWTYRLLMQAFGTSTFGGLPDRLSRRPAPRPGGSTVRVPRLRLGGVVIARDTWVVPRGEVPLRDPGEAALAHLARLTRWRREHAIPRCCFVGAVRDPRHDAGKNRKPCYVDFSSPVFLRVFAQLLAQTDGALVLQEVLPTGADLLLGDGTAGHAGECVVELDV